VIRFFFLPTWVLDLEFTFILWTYFFVLFCRAEQNERSQWSYYKCYLFVIRGWGTKEWRHLGSKSSDHVLVEKFHLMAPRSIFMGTESTSSKASRHGIFLTKKQILRMHFRFRFEPSFETSKHWSTLHVLFYPHSTMPPSPTFSHVQPHKFLPADSPVLDQSHTVRVWATEWNERPPRRTPHTLQLNASLFYEHFVLEISATIFLKSKSIENHQAQLEENQVIFVRHRIECNLHLQEMFFSKWLFILTVPRVNANNCSLLEINKQFCAVRKHKQLRSLENTRSSVIYSTNCTAFALVNHKTLVYSAFSETSNGCTRKIKTSLNADKNS